MSEAIPDPIDQKDVFDPHRFDVEPKKKFDKKIISIASTLGILGLLIAGFIWFGKWQLTTYFENIQKAREVERSSKSARPEMTGPMSKITFANPVEPAAYGTTEPDSKTAGYSMPLQTPRMNYGDPPRKYSPRAIPVIDVRSDAASKNRDVPNMVNRTSPLVVTEEVLVEPAMMLENIATPERKQLLPGANLMPQSVVTNLQQSGYGQQLAAVERLRSVATSLQQSAYGPQRAETPIPATFVTSSPQSASAPAPATTLRPRTVEEMAALAADQAVISATAQSTSANVGDRSRVILRGSYIECILESQLVSNIPGITACIVPTNVYSDNGKRLLIRKGSKLVGEYSATVQVGDSRFGIMWKRVKTPEGIVIDVDSSAADSVGGMGVDGAFDKHWAERLGTAFMFSVVADGISTLVQPRTVWKRKSSLKMKLMIGGLNR